MSTNHLSVAEILGPWVEPDWESGLIDRCRQAWSKPLLDLSREELAALLRQRIAVEHLLPIARQRVESDVSDDSEIYDGELAAAIVDASHATRRGIPATAAGVAFLRGNSGSETGAGKSPEGAAAAGEKSK